MPAANRQGENRFTSAISKSLVSRKVSPKGPAFGLRMLTYVLTVPEAEIEKAKGLLSSKVPQVKQS